MRCDAILHLLGVAGKLLAQRQWRRVLGMGAADLDDVGPGRGLGGERLAQSRRSAGISSREIASAAAMCMAVG